MAGTYTVDASVFLNAFNPYEKGHAESLRLLLHFHEQAVPIIVPTLLLAEVAGTISRGRQDSALAREFAEALSHLPHLMLISLDNSLARQAADIAAQYRLRGSDAVYAAVALRFGSVFVTLDREQGARVAEIIPTRSPVDAITELE